ncbi:MAG TPA: hypothetical protein VMT00_08985 [Thermoanaerobaculia bacterium]|nr:hypothetical protein [Thermoanaerobaculia bacterium]
MKPRRIDDQIREYYEGHRLSDEARARLKATVRAGVTARGSRWWWVRTAIAAGFVIGVTTAALWLAVLRTAAPESPQRITEMVAQQAALGHNERQELEFRASRTAELREAMKSLDFTPIEPEMMAAMNMHLVGARYTTLEGVIAAQILYVDPKGEPCTLYQARPVARLARLRDGDHDVDGLRVSVWREKGLLMVLARPMA